MDPEPDYERIDGVVNTAFDLDDADGTSTTTTTTTTILSATPAATANALTVTKASKTTSPQNVPQGSPSNSTPRTTTTTTTATTNTSISTSTADQSDVTPTTAIVDISEDDNCLVRRPRQRSIGSKDELLYRMSMAHLAPKGVNWGREVEKATEIKEDSAIPSRVLNALRDFPMGMTEKLALSNYLRIESGGRYSRFGLTLSMGNRTSGRANSTLSRGQKVVSDIMSSDTFGTLGLWDKPIAKITALLGTNVASYFKFLRFLAVLNAWSAIITFCFVALPQIVSDELWSDDIKRGFFGKLSQTIFFYGAYRNTSIGDDILDGTDIVYHRPLAYFLTWCSIYILSVLFIVMIMYTTYRRSKQTFGDTRDRYSAALLMGWDHSVTNKEGCRLKASALTTYFREMKLEDAEKAKLACCEKCSLFMVRVVCNLLCLTIMGGSGYLIYFVADSSMDFVGLEPTNIKDFFQKYQLTLLVSTLKIIIPPVLSLLLYFEKWQPRTAIKVQLARTAVFYAASLLSFLISVYTMSIQCESSTNTNSTPRAINSPFLPVVSLKFRLSPMKPDYCCWENEVGEQLFQVVILDLIVNVGVGLLFMAGRALVVKKWFRFRMLGNAEFNVAAEILDLVYGQALIWLGLYAAPCLAVVGFIKLILQFYFFYNMAALFCDPPTSIFRASRSGGFFRFVLLVTLFLCMFPLTYMIVSLEPSKSCGPFQTKDRVYKVFTETIGDSPDWLRTIIFYITTPAVVVPVFILLLLLVLYYRVKSSTQKKTAKRIRLQFKMKRQLEKRQLFSKNRLQRGMSAYQRNK